jgi:hypothetical protein
MQNENLSYFDINLASKKPHPCDILPSLYNEIILKVSSPLSASHLI